MAKRISVAVGDSDKILTGCAFNTSSPVTVCSATGNASTVGSSSWLLLCASTFLPLVITWGSELEQPATKEKRNTITPNANSLLNIFIGYPPSKYFRLGTQQRTCLTSRMFVLSWTRPDSFTESMRIYRCGTVPESNRTSEPLQNYFVFSGTEFSSL